MEGRDISILQLNCNIKLQNSNLRSALHHLEHLLLYLILMRLRIIRLMIQ
jgi:hypothetical protein